MGTNLNFKPFGDEPVAEGSGSGRQSGSSFNFPLPRQTSIYSLTFDEFRNSLGKEFGSLNMDELLKSIWKAEDALNTASTSTTTGGGGGQFGINQGGYLQRQGSHTLPRTLSQKTVDEVWRDMSNDFNTGKDSDLAQTPQRQPTLAEITLEEFLVRAGIVREDAQLAEKPNPGGSLGKLVQPNNINNTGFGIDFQQPGHGVGSSQQPQQLQQSPVFTKQSVVPYAQTMAMNSSTPMGKLGIRSGGGGGVGVGFSNQTANGNLGQGFGLQGGAMGAPTESPANLSSDGIAKRNGVMPFVSSVPYGFNGGIRGRKSSNTVEKVIERRQKRMIKNRESAARSRARKQAYTTELEEEVTKLKEENDELRLKQEEIKEMHKKQSQEEMLKKDTDGSLVKSQWSELKSSDLPLMSYRHWRQRQILYYS
ncbi:hypothetical protein V2J09_011768 [Rumex salicifolius]